MLPYIFIIDGPDAVGKTSIIDGLVHYFNSSTSYPAIKLAPMGTPLGKEIKKLITTNYIDQDTERCLAKASLFHLYHDHILPHKDNEKLIIFIDRWTLSHYVHQGYINNNLYDIIDGAVEIEALFQPTGHYVLDIDEDILDKRLATRLENRDDKFEQLETAKEIREAYRELALRKEYKVFHLVEDLDKNIKMILASIIRKLR